MSIDEKKAVIQNWLAARNSHNLEAALACWTDENHEWLTQAFNLFTMAFPDIHVTINDSVVEGDKVVGMWTLTGTHQGIWFGIPATGNPVEWKGIDVCTIVNRKIASLDRAADNLALFKQLGAVLMWQDQIIE